MMIGMARELETFITQHTRLRSELKLVFIQARVLSRGSYGRLRYYCILLVMYIYTTTTHMLTEHTSRISSLHDDSDITHLCCPLLLLLLSLVLETDDYLSKY